MGSCLVLVGNGIGIPVGEMEMSLDLNTVDAVCDGVDRDRLLRTAVELVDIPSPTRSAAQVADHLANLLTDAGFEVSREAAGWPESPAVVARMATGRPGRTLQFLSLIHISEPTRPY